MDDIKISLSEKKTSGKISEIRVDGVIDTLTASELERVIESLIGRSRFNVVIDLAGVEYISSAGWGILIAHIREVRDCDGDIKLANMQPDVFEVFELLEFDNVLHSFDSVRDAVSAFSLGDDGAGPAKSGDLSSKPKKKELGEARIAIVGDLSHQPISNPSADSTYLVDASGSTSRDIDTEIMCFVKSDPFAAISEIRDHVNNAFKESAVNWWQVFGILKRNRLLRRKSRFRLAWGRL